MNIDVRVPEMGESITSATVASWLKQPGDPVAKGEPLLLLETEKASLEVSAEAGGVLEEVIKEQGSTVRIGEVLGRIREGAEVLARPQAQLASLREATEDTVREGRRAEPTRQAAPPGPTAPGQATTPQAPAGIPQDLNVSPIAKRVAEQYGVDLNDVQGTGGGGRVTKEDVERHVQRLLRGRPETAPPVAPSGPATARRTAEPRVETSREAPPAPTPPAPPIRPAAAPAPQAGLRPSAAGAREERIRLSPRRLTMARRMAETNQTAAMATTYNEVDMKAVMDLRTRRREAFKKKHNVDLGFMPFFVKASVQALKGYPSLNAELQEDELVLKRYYDIGIAVGMEEGLVVPVLRGADEKSFADIEAAIAAMVQKAKDRRLTLEDLRGGTFTITNGGVFGSMWSTPILNLPQTGILGMHRIEERPVVREGQVVVRPMMYLALTYDHRVVDGREAVLGLARIKEVLEDPTTLLLDL